MFWFGLGDLPHRINGVAVFVGRIFFISSIILIGCSDVELIEFDACGFKEGSTGDHSVAHTEKAVRIETIFIEKSSVIEVVGFKSEYFDGPVCTTIKYAGGERHVVGDIETVKKKLGIQ